MKKRKFLIADKAKFDAQGRGLGRDEYYKPGLYTRDVPSKGQRQRVFLLRFKRLFEMMSHGETLTLLQLDWNDDVIEIREQYPLDPSLTVKIAKELNLLHPGYTSGGSIMTTDFLVTYKRKNNFSYQRAYQIKHSQSDLDDGRTLAKLQIEETYWKNKGIAWRVVLSANYNKVYCDNLELLQPFRNGIYSSNYLKLLHKYIQPIISKNSELLYSNLSGFVETSSENNFRISFHECIKILLSKKILTFPIRNIRLQECKLGFFSEVGKC